MAYFYDTVGYYRWVGEASGAGDSLLPSATPLRHHAPPQHPCALHGPLPPRAMTQLRRCGAV